MDKRWYSIAEAAEYFSMKKKTLYGLVGRGLIRDDAVLRLGRQLRIDIKKVEEEGIQTNASTK